MTTSALTEFVVRRRLGPVREIESAYADACTRVEELEAAEDASNVLLELREEFVGIRHGPIARLWQVLSDECASDLVSAVFDEGEAIISNIDAAVKEANWAIKPGYKRHDRCKPKIFVEPVLKFFELTKLMCSQCKYCCSRVVNSL